MEDLSIWGVEALAWATSGTDKLRLSGVYRWAASEQANVRLAGGRLIFGRFVSGGQSTVRLLRSKPLWIVAVMTQYDTEQRLVVLVAATLAISGIPFSAWPGYSAAVLLPGNFRSL